MLQTCASTGYASIKDVNVIRECAAYSTWVKKIYFSYIDNKFSKFGFQFLVRNATNTSYEKLHSLLYL